MRSGSGLRGFAGLRNARFSSGLNTGQCYLGRRTPCWDKLFGAGCIGGHAKSCDDMALYALPFVEAIFYSLGALCVSPFTKRR